MTLRLPETMMSPGFRVTFPRIWLRLPLMLRAEKAFRDDVFFVIVFSSDSRVKMPLSPFPDTEFRSIRTSWEKIRAIPLFSVGRPLWAAELRSTQLFEDSERIRPTKEFAEADRPRKRL